MLVSKYPSTLVRFCAKECRTLYTTPKSWNTLGKQRHMSTLTVSTQQRAVIQTQEAYSSAVAPEAEPKTDYSVEEVRIPTIGGFIAGKLWRGSQADAGVTPLICMHGWLDNAGTFDTLLPLILKPHMTALAIDFPGHGYSSYHTPPLHYDAHVESMIAVHSILQFYNWKKFTILGHSLGAIVGFVLAGVFPEIVEKYIALENVRPIPKDCKTELRYSLLKLLDIEKKRQQEQLQLATASATTPTTTSPSYSYDEIVNRFYKGRNGTISIEGCKVLMKRGSIQLDSGLYRFTHDIRAAFPTGLWRFSPSHTEEIATAISCPVCFIKGEPGGDYEDRSKYDQIVQLMQLNNTNEVEYHHVEGTHHFHLNNPFPVAPIITKFLES